MHTLSKLIFLLDALYEGSITRIEEDQNDVLVNLDLPNVLARHGIGQIVIRFYSMSLFYVIRPGADLKESITSLRGIQDMHLLFNEVSLESDLRQYENTNVLKISFETSQVPYHDPTSSNLMTDYDLYVSAMGFEVYDNCMTQVLHIDQMIKWAGEYYQGEI